MLIVFADFYAACLSPDSIGTRSASNRLKPYHDTLRIFSEAATGSIMKALLDSLAEQLEKKCLRNVGVCSFN